jgi:hypothetical protein
VRRPARRTLGLVLAACGLVAALGVVTGRRGSESAATAGVTSSSPAEVASLRPAGTVGNGREPLGGDAPERAAAANGPDDLVATLRRIAALEVELVESSGGGRDEVDPELVAELEAVLQPVLVEPALPIAILALLASGELRAVQPVEPGSGTTRGLSPVEYGAVRALYWAVVSRRDPTSEVRVAESAHALLLEVLEVLHVLDAAPRHELLRQLSLARLADGSPVVDATLLSAILTLQAQHPDLGESLALLIGAIGDSLPADERDDFFAILVPETQDAALAGLMLGRLLRGDSPEIALLLAESRYDHTESGAALRRAIASAVAEHAALPDATRFLSERVDTTAYDHTAWLGLGMREGATPVLDEAYQALVAKDTEPKAREMLVNAMTNAPDARLLAIAFDDPSPSVAGQALMNLTYRPDARPEPAVLELLRRPGRSGSLDPTKAMYAAACLVRQARSAGETELATEATRYLHEFVERADVPLHARRQAFEQLTTLVSPAELPPAPGGATRDR